MTQLDPKSFKKNAHNALTDTELQRAMAKAERNFLAKRLGAVNKLPEFEALRDEARGIKNHVLAHLDLYLEAFETRVQEAGGHVHWCATPEEARAAVLKICQEKGAKTVTKGKSMIGEEIEINGFLERHGIEPVETDLGEYIIQLAGETPSHIIGPAVHKTKEQVADLFLKHHEKLGYTRRLTEGEEMVAEARAILRQRYLEADVGITGANFLIAETGSTVIVTNEGNGDLTQSLPRTHIVLASIEKIVPTLEDVSTILRVLARSATGQEFSVYTTFSTGPKRQGDADGPDDFHVILLDNGRTRLLGTEFEEVLRCIRCGACMNHCPVYATVGGHAYGSVYMGPIGAVLTPNLVGLADGRHLPNASTFCGRCEEVCPMRIPLPKLMRSWREKSFAQGESPAAERFGISLWSWAAARPWAYRIGVDLASRVLSVLARGRGRYPALPLAEGWTDGRDLPAPPPGGTFMAQYKAKGGRR
ncbi:LutB/LldF family L-lactate oxidation iron-sulfur protein [Futiania mangrovi]|uniref:LutB/LldF family L-lactate oxidation iron-sulfur protein n=1 Tax=Futiania mangrovi TaxID=2959716 RepID=A0A9J6PDP0_9PROT|nr:LutB/LldF family L-lactate oxidation iron-sulfur protein [Futiania mangrovii]MCP1336486.1 LutB/LldF family L-lactate oxidation iron-sulfur protein [Futiania mangrovii]